MHVVTKCYTHSQIEFDGVAIVNGAALLPGLLLRRHNIPTTMVRPTSLLVLASALAGASCVAAAACARLQLAESGPAAVSQTPSPAAPLCLACLTPYLQPCRPHAQLESRGAVPARSSRVPSTCGSMVRRLLVPVQLSLRESGQRVRVTHSHACPPAHHALTRTHRQRPHPLTHTHTLTHCIILFRCAELHYLDADAGNRAVEVAVSQAAFVIPQLVSLRILDGAGTVVGQTALSDCLPHPNVAPGFGVDLWVCTDFNLQMEQVR